MKPHIKKCRGLWMCSGNGVAFGGRTPMQAYDIWRMVVRAHGGVYTVRAIA